ncbi:sialic acid-binding Ig-like lectin 13 isoform X2 [Dendrobates tinctorius]|uniref:sialic acid-binding Ig-like lectin 13 isoform X2 n=1 Tax=Dendrobates tinctorius TaxID=92724 RepID=UPI003CC9E747
MMLFSHEYCWVLTFLVLQMWNIGCKVQGYSMNAPSVTAQDGLCAYISCTFTKPSDVSIDKCLWYRINPGAAKEIVASTKNNPSSRIFFTGDVNKGDCSLIINDVEKNDEANYQFRLEAVKPKDNFNYGTTPKVTVTDLKEKPEISVGTLVAGKEATVTCRSPGVCAGTAPGFTWTGQYGESLNYNNSYSNLTSIYFSNFTFTPARIDNGKSLECKVAFLSNTAVTQQTIKLNVEYPPDVIITFKGGLGDNTFIVKEGDSAQINCTVDSNPIAEITWFMGNDKKEAMNRQWIIYNLTNVTLNDAGKYSCTGKNNLGSSEKNIDITVYYAPRTPNINCATTQAQPRSDSGIIIAVTCVVVIVLLLIAGTLVMYYFRKKKLSKKSEDKKEMNADDSSVIYANSEVHIYGNQTQETGTNSVYSVPEDNNTSEYMNFDDIHYATIDFSKLKRTNAPKGTEINYAEIKK